MFEMSASHASFLCNLRNIRRNCGLQGEKIKVGDTLIVDIINGTESNRLLVEVDDRSYKDCNKPGFQVTCRPMSGMYVSFFFNLDGFLEYGYDCNPEFAGDSFYYLRRPMPGEILELQERDRVAANTDLVKKRNEEANDDVFDRKVFETQTIQRIKDDIAKLNEFIAHFTSRINYLETRSGRF